MSKDDAVLVKLRDQDQAIHSQGYAVLTMTTGRALELIAELAEAISSAHVEGRPRLQVTGFAEIEVYNNPVLATRAAYRWTGEA